MKKPVRCILLVFFALLLLAGQAFGQRPGLGYYNPSKERFGNNTLSVQAFPFIFGGYGLSYSRNVFNQRHWVGISPILYTSSNNHTTRLKEKQKMLGFSVNLNYRYNYFELPDVGFRMFFQCGLEYSYLDIRNVAQAETHIEKAGLDIAIGFRQNIAKPLYFEFFIGYGQRWLTNFNVNSSRVSSGIADLEIREPHYDGHIFDYGRGGSVLVLGLNLGFLF
ncbi:MAG: outer membrane beta-barrel protein [Bacteroides sp.]|nr:outer membrane beta-barrel protein [Bacteroides sp.]MCM1085139.1 outer membrane beta-barrel protein [Bacteroides sp.]